MATEEKNVISLSGILVENDTLLSISLFLDPYVSVMKETALCVGLKHSL